GKVFFENRMKKLYSLMFWISFVIALLITVLAYPIIKVLFGTAYIEAVPTLQIYVWAGICIFQNVAIGYYMLAVNLTKLQFYNTVIGAVLNIVLNIILIPKLGINGAAIATLISYTAATFGIVLFKESRGQVLLIFRSISNFK
ncbi:MAG: polysaccharide biosynthesis C-terminal domain-containing protein, partial [Candidatus Staskawiczbacteria bacterium]